MLRYNRDDDTTCGSLAASSFPAGGFQQSFVVLHHGHEQREILAVKATAILMAARPASLHPMAQHSSACYVLHWERR